jgi:hypothetical protein
MADDRYASPTGNAGNGGTNFTTDAWDYPTLIANMAPDRRSNLLGGTYNLSATPSMVGGSSAAGFSSLIGWNAAGDALASSWDDCPIIDGGDTYGLSATTTIDYMFFHGLKFQNMATMDVDDYTIWHKCWADSSAVGFSPDSYTQYFFCRATNSVAAGLEGGFGSLIFGCEAWGNGNQGLRSWNTACNMILCYSSDNNDGVGYSSTHLNALIMNTINGNANSGVYSPGSGLIMAMLGNIFTNNVDAGVEAASSTRLVLEALSNYYGNGASRTNISVLQSIGETTLDPSFVNIGSNDYTIAEGQLMGLQINDKMLSEFNIGAYQNANGGGGGGGGGGASPSLISMPTSGRR